MNYTIYDAGTGEILNVFYTNDATTQAEYLVGKTYIEGSFSGKDYYVENAQAVAKPVKPIGINQYTFDYATKSWIIDLTATTNQVKLIRNNLLASNIDKVNPIWYASLSADQQTELQNYRQLLLDIPQQPGYPIDVVWPEKPNWL